MRLELYIVGKTQILHRAEVMIKTDDDKLIAFYPDSKEGLLYNYDYFFPEDTTQMDVFQTVGKHLRRAIRRLPLDFARDHDESPRNHCIVGS